MLCCWRHRHRHHHRPPPYRQDEVSPSSFLTKTADHRNTCTCRAFQGVSVVQLGTWWLQTFYLYTFPIVPIVYCRCSWLSRHRKYSNLLKLRIGKQPTQTYSQKLRVPKDLVWTTTGFCQPIIKALFPRSCQAIVSSMPRGGWAVGLAHDRLDVAGVHSEL